MHHHDDAWTSHKSIKLKLRCKLEIITTCKEREKERENALIKSMRNYRRYDFNVNICSERYTKTKKKKEERNNNAMRVILNKAFRSIVYLVRWHFSR